jgi:hypothetical protein
VAAAAPAAPAPPTVHVCYFTSPSGEKVAVYYLLKDGQYTPIPPPFGMTSAPQ